VILYHTYYIIVHQVIIIIWHLISWYLRIYYFSTFIIFVYNTSHIMIFVILITFWLYSHSFQYLYICILLFLVSTTLSFIQYLNIKWQYFSFKTLRYFRIFLNYIITSTHYYVIFTIPIISDWKWRWIILLYSFNVSAESFYNAQL